MKTGQNTENKLRVYSFYGYGEQELYDLMAGLFGVERVGFDRNVILLTDVTEGEFIEKYKKACILRFRGEKDLICIDRDDKFSCR